MSQENGGGEEERNAEKKNAQKFLKKVGPDPEDKIKEEFAKLRKRVEAKIEKTKTKLKALDQSKKRGNHQKSEKLFEKLNQGQDTLEGLQQMEDMVQNEIRIAQEILGDSNKNAEHTISTKLPALEKPSKQPYSERTKDTKPHVKKKSKKEKGENKPTLASSGTATVDPTAAKKAAKVQLKNVITDSKEQLKKDERKYKEFKSADKKNVTLLNKEQAKYNKITAPIEQINIKQKKLRDDLVEQKTLITDLLGAVDSKKQSTIELTEKLGDPATFAGLNPKEIKLENQNLKNQLKENKASLKLSQAQLKSETKNYKIAFVKAIKEDRKFQTSKKPLVEKLQDQAEKVTAAEMSAKEARNNIAQNPVYRESQHLHTPIQAFNKTDLEKITKNSEQLPKGFKVLEDAFDKPLEKSDKKAAKANFEVSLKESKKNTKELAGLENHKQRQGTKLSKAAAKLQSIQQEVRKKASNVISTQAKLEARRKLQTKLGEDAEVASSGVLTLARGGNITKSTVKEQEKLEKEYNNLTKKLKKLENKIAKTEQKLEVREEKLTATQKKLEKPQAKVDHYNKKIKEDTQEIDGNKFTTDRAKRTDISPPDGPTHSYSPQNPDTPSRPIVIITGPQSALKSSMTYMQSVKLPDGNTNPHLELAKAAQDIQKRFAATPKQKAPDEQLQSDYAALCGLAHAQDAQYHLAWKKHYNELGKKVPELKEWCKAWEKHAESNAQTAINHANVNIAISEGKARYESVKDDALFQSAYGAVQQVEAEVKADKDIARTDTRESVAKKEALEKSPTKSLEEKVDALLPNIKKIREDQRQTLVDLLGVMDNIKHSLDDRNSELSEDKDNATLKQYINVLTGYLEKAEQIKNSIEEVLSNEEKLHAEAMGMRNMLTGGKDKAKELPRAEEHSGDALEKVAKAAKEAIIGAKAPLEQEPEVAAPSTATLEEQLVKSFEPAAPVVPAPAVAAPAAEKESVAVAPTVATTQVVAEPVEAQESVAVDPAVLTTPVSAAAEAAPQVEAAVAAPSQEPIGAPSAPPQPAPEQPVAATEAKATESQPDQSEHHNIATKIESSLREAGPKTQFVHSGQPTPAVAVAKTPVNIKFAALKAAEAAQLDNSSHA